MKRIIIQSGFIAVVLFAGTLFPSGELDVAQEHRNTSPVSHTTRVESTPRVYIGSGSFIVELADTAKLRSQGLSGRVPLREDAGMLFIFDAQEVHQFWMKDMLFAIDIIWISADKKVVYIEEYARPDSFPTIFNPDRPALYVLEVLAGTVMKKNIRIGSTVQFE